MGESRLGSYLRSEMERKKQIRAFSNKGQFLRHVDAVCFIERGRGLVEMLCGLSRVFFVDAQVDVVGGQAIDKGNVIVGLVIYHAIGN